MNRMVFYIVLLFGLMSCGMQKTFVSQDVQADSRTESSDSSALHSMIEKIVQSQLDELLDKKLDNDLTVERRTWSPPDTSGKQYLVTEEKMISATRLTETRKTVKADMENIVEKTDSMQVSASAQDLVLDSTVDVTDKEGLTWWQKTLMMIGAAVILMLIIKIALKLI